MLSDSRIRYIHNDQRTGLIAQRNQALKESRCEWVAILDADDVARPERLQKQWEFLHANPSISVLGSWIEIIDQNGQLVGLRRYPECHDAIMRTMRRYNAIAQPAVVLCKQAVDSVGGYADEYPVAEDYELWSRLIASGYRVANLQLPLLKYRIHAAASKTERLRELLRMTIKVKRHYYMRNFNSVDWLRYLAEHCMLCLPPILVYKLFFMLTFRKPVTHQSA